MDDRPVIMDIDGALARVTLNDPARRNALSYRMVEALIGTLRRADGDQRVRVVVVQGAGEHFSAGADLSEFGAELDRPAVRHWESGALWEELFTLLPTMSKPVLAAVRGYALGGGCGLVAACDLVVAAEDARLGMPEINVGLFPLLVLPALRRAVGDRKARELALTGAVVDGVEAARIGLVHRAVPPGDLDAAATAMAGELAKKGPEAVRLGKHVFYATADMTYPQALAFARSLRVTYLLSEGLREGVEAFLAKRKPRS